MNLSCCCLETGLKPFLFLSGKILRGDDAPLAAELESWLKENPGEFYLFSRYSNFSGIMKHYSTIFKRINNKTINLRYWPGSKSEYLSRTTTILKS